MKKKSLLFILSFLLGGGIFAWIIRLVGWDEIQSTFFTLSIWQISLVFVLYLLIPLLEGLRWKEILKTQNKEISLKDSCKLGVIGFSINFLFPILFGATDFFRGYYLKEKKKYSGIKVSSSIIIDRIIGWTVNVLLIVLGVFWFFYKTRTIPDNLLIYVSWFFLFFIISLIFFYFRVLNKKSIVEIFYKFFNEKAKNISQEVEKDVFIFFNLSKKKAIKPFLISLVKDLIMMLIIWLLMMFLQVRISLLSAFFILAFTYLIIIIPLPASLGSHEVIQIFIFKRHVF